MPFDKSSVGIKRRAAGYFFLDGGLYEEASTTAAKDAMTKPRISSKTIPLARLFSSAKPVETPMSLPATGPRNLCLM